MNAAQPNRGRRDAEDRRAWSRQIVSLLKGKGPDVGTGAGPPGTGCKRAEGSHPHQNLRRVGKVPMAGTPAANPTPPQGECAKKKKARHAWLARGPSQGGNRPNLGDPRSRHSKTKQAACRSAAEVAEASRRHSGQQNGRRTEGVDARHRSRTSNERSGTKPS